MRSQLSRWLAFVGLALALCLTPVTVQPAQDYEQGSSNSRFDFNYEAAADAPAQGTNVTVAGWVKDTGDKGGSVRIVVRDESVDGDRVYQFTTDANENVSFIIFVSNSAHSAIGATAFSLNAWHWVAGTYDGKTVNVYLDSSTSDGSNTTPSGNLDADVVGISLGARSERNDGSTATEPTGDASIAEVAEWNRVLSAGELSALAAGYSPLFIPNGLVWYAPLIREGDPVVDRYIRRIALDIKVESTGGTISVVNHPRIIYTAMPYVITSPAAAAAANAGVIGGGVGGAAYVIGN